MSLNVKDKPTSKNEPAWEIARLFPHQGHWSDADYLDLAHRTNNLVELADGRIEVLPLPTLSHQRIVLFLCRALSIFLADRRLGEALIAPYPVRLAAGRFREPDVLVMLAEHADRLTEQNAELADMVVEVVSQDREKDLEIKRIEYAAAGIPEYWIVDPQEQRITVLTLGTSSEYAVHGLFTPGHKARSSLLPGFEVDVSAVFAAGRGQS